MQQTSDPTPQAESLRRVRRGALCSGCGGCAAIAPDAIRMEAEAPGYLRPRQTAPLTEAQDRMIRAVCPGLGETISAGSRRDDSLWGPYVSAATGWATDPAIRHAGSSGGVLTALALHLVASGRVDAVLTNMADPDMPIGNVATVVADRRGAVAAAGSRYAPSAPLSGLPALVASGKRHAFIGKPCDAAALRALAAADPAVARAFPVVLSFFCAGVPSHRGGEEILAAMGTTLAQTRAFRYRGNGWPGMARADLNDGTHREMSYHDSWGGILTRHVQHRCKVCADGTGMAADLVCADAWESDADGYPVFAERDGVSLVLARTPLGAELIAGAVASGVVTTAPFDMAALPAMQPGQRFRRRVVLARLIALALAGRPIPRYRGLHLVAAAADGSPRLFFQNFIGMLRRVLSGRA
jgi:coenzyme F420 hydrogenase subunit beta